MLGNAAVKEEFDLISIRLAFRYFNTIGDRELQLMQLTLTVSFRNRHRELTRPPLLLSSRPARLLAPSLPHTAAAALPALSLHSHSHTRAPSFPACLAPVSHKKNINTVLPQNFTRKYTHLPQNALENSRGGPPAGQLPPPAAPPLHLNCRALPHSATRSCPPNLRTESVLTEGFGGGGLLVLGTAVGSMRRGKKAPLHSEETQRLRRGTPAKRRGNAPVALRDAPLRRRSCAPCWSSERVARISSVSPSARRASTPTRRVSPPAPSSNTRSTNG